MCDGFYAHVCSCVCRACGNYERHTYPLAFMRYPAMVSMPLMQIHARDAQGIYTLCSVNIRVHRNVCKRFPQPLYWTSYRTTSTRIWWLSSSSKQMDAETYEQWYATPQGRWIGQREVALLLEELQPRPGESLLDVGCGTGFFTRALAAAIEGPVAGVDINPEWLAYARGQQTANVSYEVADVRALPFAAKSFDLVASVTALCFVAEERVAVSEMLRVARRRVAIGLLNRRSLLWLRNGRNGGRSGYRGARWHTVREATELFAGLPVQRIRVRTAIHFPGGGRLARILERVWPQWLHTGAFILVVAEMGEADVKRDA